MVPWEIPTPANKIMYHDKLLNKHKSKSAKLIFDTYTLICFPQRTTSSFNHVTTGGGLPLMTTENVTSSCGFALISSIISSKQGLISCKNLDESFDS